jgi:antitoxin component of MazEF toxin-antitoxin module
MGDKQEGSEDVRKLQVTGKDGNSYMVTLPKALVKKLGWREGQKVTVHQRGQELVIKDWQVE